MHNLMHLGNDFIFIYIKKKLETTYILSKESIVDHVGDFCSKTVQIMQDLGFKFWLRTLISKRHARLGFLGNLKEKLEEKKKWKEKN